MKIFLFNKYLPTSGGGEKHAGGIAEVLSKKHDVTILYSGEANVTLISSKLNLDLSRVKFVSFSEERNIYSQVMEFIQSNRPDIFINATYFSTFVAPNAVNISLVFFPKFNLTRKPSTYDTLVHKVGEEFFNRYDSTVRFFEGFYNEEINGNKVGRWSTANSTLLITKPFNKLKIFFKPLEGRIVRDVVKSIKIHGNKLNFSFYKDIIEIESPVKHSCGIHLKFDTFKPSDSFKNNFDSRNLGLFIRLVYIDTHDVFTKWVIKAWNSKVLGKYLTRIYVKWTVIKEYNWNRGFLEANLNISNSDYTSSWIKRIYGEKGIKVEKLYPPVDVEHFFNSSEKKNVILAVGRFFVGGHNKKQQEIIKAFKNAYASHPDFRDYKLVICGGTHPEDHHQDYLKLCKLSAQGYPIEICTDIAFSDLKAKYATAKFFWHAAGMYENEDLAPDRFEHFGITTVEAMAAGCVPIVIGVAGQKEIVSHRQNGMLWRNEQELISHTVELIKNEDLREQLSVNAIAASKQYSKMNFNHRVEEIFKEYLK
ncbi:hypothetical protein TH61_12725 [Rufibacter sp. DG15C]|uniref:glycosyltransferase n=1 Tax=Rufibacter sp. DG15C TaxID=1379909 RepID=UPI00078E7A9E|nr:glycosyltransferase [Rufibacter sp. DG15C]AMM51867.1 hypothetical protein TH61_12725 [Rufibacter sp. DG15C]